MISVDDMVNSLSDNILKLFDNFALLRLLRSRTRSNVPWIGSEVRQVICFRNKAWRRGRIQKTDEAKQMFCVLRYAVTRLITDSKRRYFD